MPLVLTIAGSDPTGGAGLQADLKTFAAFGVQGAAVPTLLTVQDTRGVREVQVLDADLVQRQLRALLDDLPVAQIKIGALGNGEVVEAVAAELARADAPRAVLDPVMGAGAGKALSEDDVATALHRHLLPMTRLLTPNLVEAGHLLGRRVDTVEAMIEAAADLSEMGPDAVLLKGGHLEGQLLVDVLHVADDNLILPGKRQAATAHGTGCALSSAIAAQLARGHGLESSCRAAISWLREAMARGFDMGGGQRLLNHGWRAPPLDEQANHTPAAPSTEGDPGHGR